MQIFNCIHYEHNGYKKRFIFCYLNCKTDRLNSSLLMFAIFGVYFLLVNILLCE